MDLSLIIPVYNEEENLRALFDAICSALKPLGRTWEVVFIDDGSTDASLGILRQLAQQEPESVRVIVFRRNFGQTAAIAAGLDNSRGDIILLMDADLQNEPNWVGYQRPPFPTTVWTLQSAAPPPGAGVKYQQIANTSGTGGGGVRQDLTGCTIGARIRYPVGCGGTPRMRPAQ